MHKTLGHHDA